MRKLIFVLFLAAIFYACGNDTPIASNDPGFFELEGTWVSVKTTPPDPQFDQLGIRAALTMGKPSGIPYIGPDSQFVILYSVRFSIDGLDSVRVIPYNLVGDTAYFGVSQFPAKEGDSLVYNATMIRRDNPGFHAYHWVGLEMQFLDTGNTWMSANRTAYRVIEYEYPYHQFILKQQDVASEFAGYHHKGVVRDGETVIHQVKDSLRLVVYKNDTLRWWDMNHPGLNTMYYVNAAQDSLRDATGEYLMVKGPRIDTAGLE